MMGREARIPIGVSGATFSRAHDGLPGKNDDVIVNFLSE
jgi:hypothetical protein